MLKGKTRFTGNGWLYFTLIMSEVKLGSQIMVGDVTYRYTCKIGYAMGSRYDILLEYT